MPAGRHNGLRAVVAMLYDHVRLFCVRVCFTTCLMARKECGGGKKNEKQQTIQ